MSVYALKSLTVPPGFQVIDSSLIATLLDPQIVAAPGEIDALQSSMGIVQSDISTLQSSMGTAQSNINTLQSNMGTAQSNIGNLQSQASDLEQRAASAWAIIDGSTRTILAGYNVASVGGTNGTYSFVFTTNLPANYACVYSYYQLTNPSNDNFNKFDYITSLAVGGVTIVTHGYPSGLATNFDRVHMACFSL